MKMPFGKYKGQEIDDIPADYLEWCLTNCTLSYQLEEEMQSQLAMKQGQGRVVKKDGSHGSY